jgi:hypothetical protein
MSRFCNEIASTPVTFIEDRKESVINAFLTVWCVYSRRYDFIILPPRLLMKFGLPSTEKLGARRSIISPYEWFGSPVQHLMNVRSNIS